MNAHEFLAELWEPTTPDGHILVWSLADKLSHYSRLAADAHVGEVDSYTGVGLAHRDRGAHNRARSEEIVAIAGFWADIDINGGPDEKTGVANSWDDAYATAVLLAQPSVLVHSGYGLQAWWLFEGGAWRFRSRGEQEHAARSAMQWQGVLRSRCGHGLDHTHDLARVLRLPGTVNGKGGQRRPVEVIELGPRHHLGDLLVIAGQGGPVEIGPAGGAEYLQDITADAPPPILSRLMHESAAFARTWRHERADLTSMSEIDLSLASLAASAGASEREVAELVAHHRFLQGDRKGQRPDYLARTVARAKQRVEEPSKALAGTLMADQWAQAIRSQLRDVRPDAIPMPFEVFNRALDGGLRPGDVCLIAGYTSHGKSVWIDQMADSAAAAGQRVHLYLTEMTAYERGIRLLARRAHIPFRKLRRRELDERDWRLIEGALAKLPYGCSIVSDWSVEDVVAHILAARWDQCYVDLIHGFDYRDERELSKTSSAIVRAAKTAEKPISIVYCAHLNDGQMRDTRSAKRPMPGLHSIKGASSLKQDADVVMFVWMEDDDDGRPTGSGAVWIAKARQGGLAKAYVTLDPSRMQFEELGKRVAA